MQRGSGSGSGSGQTVREIGEGETEAAERTEEEERNGRATATGGWTRRMPIVLGPTYADEGRRPVRAHRLRVRSADITGCPLDYSRQKLSATKIYNGIGMSNICLVPL